jgi:hypothetical protein
MRLKTRIDGAIKGLAGMLLRHYRRQAKTSAHDLPTRMMYLKDRLN